MAPATNPKPKKTTGAKKTPTPTPAETPAERPEPCSTLSPDGAFSCDLPTGHDGILTNHTSTDADGRMWLNGTWRGAKAPREIAGADFAESEAEEPALFDRLAAAWEEIVGKKLAKISSPVKIEGLVLTVDTATADVSQQMSFIADRIIHELRALDPASPVHQIALRVKGTLGQSLAIVKPLEVPEGEIKTTVDGQDALVVLDGTTGAPKTDKPIVEPLLPSLAEIEARIVIAWDDLQDAELEKKRATTAHKEAQDYLNALVKEQVKRTRGGKQRQLALGESTDDEQPNEDVRACEGCKAPATTEDSEGVPLCAECREAFACKALAPDYDALPANTLIVSVRENDEDDSDCYSLMHRAWDAADAAGVSFEAGRESVIALLRQGDLQIAPEGTPATVKTCRICGCSDDFACDPPCRWVEEGLCDSKACVAA